MAFGQQYQPYWNYQAPFYPAPQQNVPDYRQPMQPLQPPTAPPAPQQYGFLWVDGIEEANSYFVAPNNAVQLWDKNAPYIYKKSADAAGKPTMQVFELVERKTAQNDLRASEDETNGFIRRNEFNELKGIVEALAAKKTKVKAKEVEEDA